jgi:DNA repair protein RecO (recombination protein O)
MSAEKTESVILSVIPYRETSCITRLFTRSLGLVHGIAKGVRKGGKSATPLDRGFLLDALVYYRPNRELHTLGGLHVANFFPGIRSDLTKSAVRDIALELYLKSITQSEPHPELFDLIVSFFADMEESLRPELLFPLLWRFIHNYCVMTGFGIDTKICKVCGNDIRHAVITTGTDTTDNRYLLEFDSGALVCGKCALSKAYGRNITGVGIDRGIDASVIRFIDGVDIGDSNDINIAAPRNYGKNEYLRVTELLLLYCRRHLDIQAQFNSLEFVKSMF